MILCKIQNKHNIVYYILYIEFFVMFPTIKWFGIKLNLGEKVKQLMGI